MKVGGLVIAAGLFATAVVAVAVDRDARDAWSKDPSKPIKDRLQDAAVEWARKKAGPSQPSQRSVLELTKDGVKVGKAVGLLGARSTTLGQQTEERPTPIYMEPEQGAASLPKPVPAPSRSQAASLGVERNPSPPPAARPSLLHKSGAVHTAKGSWRRMSEAKFFKQHPEVKLYAAARDRQQALSDEQAFRLLEKLESIIEGAPSRCSIVGTFGVQEYGFGDSGRVYIRRAAVSGRLDVVLLGNKQTQQDDCDRLRSEFGH